MKKNLAFLLVLVLLAATVLAGAHLIPSTAEAASYKMGDVDNDGEVTASDARLALRAAVGLENFTADQTKRADMDKDGDVTAQDARLILRTAVGLEQTTIVDETEPTQPAEEGPSNFVPVNPQPDMPDDYVNYTLVCRYCGREDCQSLPGYHDGVMGFDYLCPEYDMTKDPNPDYTKVCRYCGKTDCVTLEKDEHGFFVHPGTDCPKYDVHRDPAEYCQTCGLVIGDPAPNTCAKLSSWYDIYCPACGTFLPVGTCHHCKGNSQGYAWIYNISTGELE